MAESSLKTLQLGSVPQSFWVDWTDLDFKDSTILGSGGFGAVRLANHKDWGTVAVKQTLLKAQCMTEKEKKDIEKEVDKLWKAISCPYVVHVMGVAQEPDHGVNIIMEYMKKGNLKSLTPKLTNQVIWPLRARMIRDMVLGMNFLHTLKPEPLVHRDLKLENMFVTENFVVKIGDLGLTCSTTSFEQIEDQPGTFTHMPPEVLSGNFPPKWDLRSWDVWSFAITLFEFLSNDDPWQQFANITLVTLWLCNFGKRPDLDLIPPSIPPPFIEEMRKCWHSNPSKRPTFKELKDTFTTLYTTRYERDLSSAMPAVWNQPKSDMKEPAPDTLRESKHAGPTPLTHQQYLPEPVQKIHKTDRDRKMVAKDLQESSGRNKPSTGHSNQWPKYNDDVPFGVKLDLSSRIKSRSLSLLSTSHTQQVKRHNKQWLNDDDNDDDDGIRFGATLDPSSRVKSRSLSPLPTSRKQQEKKSDKPITRKQILLIEQHIGKEYRQLGRHLKLSQRDIENIEMACRNFNVQEIVHNLLEEWREKRGRRATVSSLTTALCKADLPHVAKML